jgi:alpha-tubulin suppressor-like RCC1 family protein
MDKVLFITIFSMLLSSCFQVQKTVADNTQSAKKFDVEGEENYVVLEGNTLEIIDINIDKTSQEITNNLTYSCYYDQTIDGVVIGSTLCSSLTGFNFDTNDGTIDWTPGYDLVSSDELFEIKVIASDGSFQDSEVFIIRLINRNRAPELAFMSAQYIDEGVTFNDDFEDASTNSDVDADGDAIFYTCEYKYKDAVYTDLSVGQISTINALRSLVDSATTEEDYELYYANLIAYTSNFTSVTPEVWYDCTSIFQEPIPGMSFNAASGAFTWTPNKNAQHEDKVYKIKITATDGSASDSQIYSFFIQHINTDVEITDFSDIDTYSVSDVIYTYEEIPIEPIRFNAKISLSVAAGASATYFCYFDTEKDGVVESVLPCSLIGVTFDTDLDRFEYDGSVNSPASVYEVKLIRGTEEAIYSVTDLEHLQEIDDDGERVNFTCVYDTTIDGSVNSTSSCSDVGGNINGNTGVFDFVANEVSADTDYEFKISVSDKGQSTSETIFAVTVRDKPKLRLQDMTFGEDHTCGLSMAGEAYCWGDNDLGQLGVGDNFNRRFPLKIEFDSDNPIRFRKIKSHSDHTCALSYAGELYCWGDNSNGELGLGDSLSRNTPTKVELPTGITPKTITDFAVGDNHTCIVNAKGRVYCVGDNTYGQLGIGPTASTDEYSHLNISFNLFTYKNIYRIEAGSNHTCALSGSGALYCWGRNDQGQIGDTTTTDNDTPYQVDDDVFDFDLGSEHSCYIDDSLSPFCFGQNDDGQLGNGNNTDQSSPAAAGGGASAIKIRAGKAHTCMVSEQSGLDILCFGEGTQGQLGDGALTSDNTGVDATNTDSISSLFVGENSNCIFLNNGLRCWGDNEDYQFLDATTTDYDSPTDVNLDSLGYEDDDIVSVNLGSRACYTRADGVGYCTQLGIDISSSLDDGYKVFKPINENFYKEIYEFLTPGGSTGVASYITYDNRLLSYGGNSESYWSGAGSGFKSFVDAPVENTFLLDSVSTSSNHVCYLSDLLRWTCSGDGSSDQLGNSGAGDAYNYINPTRSYKKIVTGKDHTCALDLVGDIYCSGTGREVGQGASGNEDSPTLIDTSAFVNLKFINIFAGDDNTCAISDRNDLYCFGEFFTDETVEHLSAPSNTYWRTVELSSGHICAISVAGETYCMGENSEGQLGDGTGSNKSVLQRITQNLSSLNKFKELGINNDTSCGVTVGGELYCWGKNTASDMGFENLTEDAFYYQPQKYQE